VAKGPHVTPLLDPRRCLVVDPSSGLCGPVENEHYNGHDGVALQGSMDANGLFCGQHWAVARCSWDRHLEYPAYTAKETPSRPELRRKYSDSGTVSQLIALVEYVGDIKTQLDLPIFW
jgi:hypothetical protein